MPKLSARHCSLIRSLICMKKIKYWKRCTQKKIGSFFLHHSVYQLKCICFHLWPATSHQQLSTVHTQYTLSTHSRQYTLTPVHTQYTLSTHSRQYTLSTHSRQYTLSTHSVHTQYTLTHSEHTHASTHSVHTHSSNSLSNYANICTSYKALQKCACLELQFSKV